MSAEKKKELQVAALENGTAIDHIPPSQLFKVASLLGPFEDWCYMLECWTIVS